MKNFKITSMFIGILLDSNLFTNLFLQLNKYIKDNNLLNSIILQDVNSIHLTLYYLGENFSGSEKKEIQHYLHKIKRILRDLELDIISFNYFYVQGRERICYFECNNIEKIVKINHILRINFPNDILDNTYRFTPHITVFKIKDELAFKKHKGNLQKILSDFCNEIIGINTIIGVNIFKVDSSKVPELQIPIEKL